MKKTNFENVAELNRVFNMSVTEAKDINWDVLEHQFNVIREEFEELRDKGLGAKNWKEVKDGIGDILVVAYGMAYRCNLDADLLMDNISDSNFSKLCKNADEVTATVKYYDSIGVVTRVEETTLNGVRVWAIKSAKDQHYVEGGEDKFAKDGKFLKCVNWHEPDLNVEL
jgi:hypothetical protein